MKENLRSVIDPSVSNIHIHLLDLTKGRYKIKYMCRNTKAQLEKYLKSYGKKSWKEIKVSFKGSTS